MIKPGHLFICFFAGLIIGLLIFAFSGHHLGNTMVPSITKLQAQVKWQDFKIERYLDSLQEARQETQAHKKGRLEAERKAELLEYKYRLAKNDRPVTTKDSIVYLEATNIACDSVVNGLYAVRDSLKSELSSTNKYLILLDSGFNNSQQEVIDLKKLDSAHVAQLKECSRQTKKKNIKAGFVGFLLGLVAGREL